MVTNVNNVARDIFILSFSIIPDAGGFLASFCDLFWPETGEDVWEEIKEKVEQLINQKLSDLVHQQVQEDLDGLSNNINEYLWAIDNSEVPTYISEKWNFLNGEFLQQLPHFQSKGYEILLLPLFAQFANLHLGTLRDGALYGKDWGWSDAEVDHCKELLTSSITKYKSWVNETYDSYYKTLVSKTHSNDHKTEPFKTLNKFTREMTLSVLDFMNMWDYLDVVKYPDPVEVYLDREIYTDPYGTCDDYYQPAAGVSGNPKSFPKHVTVWGWDRIDAIEVVYEGGEGPNGITTTGRMGDKSGGANVEPHGGQFQVDNIIIFFIDIFNIICLFYIFYNR
jgi:hypothetical protein